MQARAPLLVALLLAAALGAGCLGAPGRSMTLRDGLADAEEAAAGWADGETLHLLGAAAVEPFRHLNQTDRDGQVVAEVVVHVDPVSGDGRAPGWIYTFVAGQRCIGALVAAGLGVLAEGYTTCKDQRWVEPLPAWSVDSDEVASILASHAGWPAAAAGNSYFWTLASRDGVPVWSVAVQGPDGTAARALVHAANGTVLALQHAGRGMPEATGPVPAPAPAPDRPEAETHGTRRDTASSPALHPLAPLAASVRLGGRGVLEVQVTSQQAAGPLQVEVVGPEGVVESTEAPGAFQGVYTDLPAGEYSVVVRTSTLALLPSVSVTGAW